MVWTHGHTQLWYGGTNDESDINQSAYRGFLLHEHTLFGNEAQHTLIVIVYKKAFGYFIHSGFWKCFSVCVKRLHAYSECMFSEIFT